MTNEEAPLLERVTSYYSQLSSVATDLNAVSDELGKSIDVIDAALKKLNLGITTWVTISSDEGIHELDDYSYWSQDIGYAKVSGKWGISLRKVDGDEHLPCEPNVEEWPFNDAPRSLRLEAIDKIPELLEKLSKDAVKTTKDIRARLGEAQAVAEAVKSAANGTKRVSSHCPPLDSVRDAVIHALSNAGHESASELLDTGSWTFDGSCLRIELPGMGKKLIALTVNMAAEKVIRQELSRLNVPGRFLVVPIERTEKTAKPIPDSDPLKGTSTEVK